MSKVRQVLSGAAAVLAMAALLLFSSEAVMSARRGLELCGRVIIPSLFPFFVVSSVMRLCGLTERLGHLLAPVMSKLFGVSGSGGAAFVLGVTGGYPLGASVVAELVRDGTVDTREGERLLAFCNNSGPAFILGAAGCGIFGSAGYGLLLYAAHVLAAATVGLLFSGSCAPGARPPVRSRCVSFGEALPEAVKTSVPTILTVCGFVVVFTVCVGTLAAAGIFSSLAGEISVSTGVGLRFSRALLTGFLEIGSGIGAMEGLAPTPVNLALCSFIIGWGGVSVHLQTSAVVSGTGMKTARHTAGRFLCGIIAAVYSLVPALLLA